MFLVLKLFFGFLTKRLPNRVFISGIGILGGVTRNIKILTDMYIAPFQVTEDSYLHAALSKKLEIHSQVSRRHSRVINFGNNFQQKAVA